MVLPEREGAAACGLLDFAMMYHGCPAYDIAHLTMDMRRSISPQLKELCIKTYLSTLNKEDKQLYKQWITVMGAHFHLKVCGQIVRWVYEGKETYLIHLPRVISYIEEALAQPPLHPLKLFLNENQIDITKYKDRVTKEHIGSLTRNDAFLKR
jgi:aminoglycoside/choline kinase family phosphotransferase